MDIIEKINKEVNYIDTVAAIKLCMISTTARDELEFSVLPRRSIGQYQAISFLVANQNEVTTILEKVDGRVDYIFVDQESKQSYKLFNYSCLMVKESKLIGYKPNDATVEATDLLVRDHFKDKFDDKSIIIIGTGNIAAKLALRFKERGANIHVYGRNYTKAVQVVTGINYILPKKEAPINVVKDLNTIKYQDVLISFVSAKHYVSGDFINLLKEQNSLAIDGGINNFSEQFIKNTNRIGIASVRLDVRLGFAYTLQKVIPETYSFLNEVKGKKFINKIEIVAGGVIGKKGSIIVDSINAPSQIVGVANGTGGIINEFEYTEQDKRRLSIIKEYMERIF
ncbi:hypothetical protein DH09_13870 [Bacillaceae bacterium JMAK1]|nr:hypothetical protein DH09_13870 [Bacillaceae bacterium JMAK1]